MNCVNNLRLIKKMVSNFKLPLAEAIKSEGGDSFKILVSVILSARTRDEVTAKACQRLFKVVSEPSDLSKLSVKELEKLIFPVGFYHNKARYLKQLSGLKSVPSEIDELIKLPGVGRKTANLVRIVAFNKDGVCVDTHVHRICNRLGFVNTSSSFETEMVLRERLPKRYWKVINYLLVLFGQHICTPLRPWCSKCLIKDCQRINVNKHR